MEKLDSAAIKKQGTGQAYTLWIMSCVKPSITMHFHVVCAQTFSNRVLSKWSEAKSNGVGETLDNERLNPKYGWQLFLALGDQPMWKDTQLMLIDLSQSRRHISFYGNKIKPVRDRNTVCSIGCTVLYLGIDCSFGKTLKICFSQRFPIDKKFQKIQTTIQSLWSEGVLMFLKEVCCAHPRLYLTELHIKTVFCF